MADPNDASQNEEREELEEVQGEEERAQMNPQMDAVSANQPEPSDEIEEVDIERAKVALNESLEKGRQEKERQEVQVSEEVEVSSPDATEAGSSSEESAEPQTLKPAAPEDNKPLPKKLGKESKSRKSNAHFLSYLAFGFIGLFVAFVVLMVLVIGGGGQDSAVLSAFGIDPAGIKDFLLLIVNLSFGLLSLLFFVILVLGIFRLLFAKKTDKEAKRKGVRGLVLGLFPLILMLVIWFFLFTFIARIEIDSERVVAEILLLEPADAEELSAPLEATFSSENVVKALQRSGLTITQVRWDLDGDAVFETEPTEFSISYLYNRRGNINVGLEVFVEGEEQSRRYSFPLAIGEARFSASEDTGTAPLQVQFDANQILPPGAKVNTLDWDFDGDGVYELTGPDNKQPRYTFEQIGTYRVHLRVVDENNIVENYYREIEIVPSDRPLLVAAIEASPGLKGQIPFQVRFDGQKSESIKGQIVGYEWDFGDGSQLQKGRSVTHVYNEPGFYTVSLTVEEDSGERSTNTVEVEVTTISSEPQARITADPSIGDDGILRGFAPFKVMLSAEESLDADGDIVDYEWGLGVDGLTRTGDKVEYTYEEVGDYTLELLVRDAAGQEHLVTQLVLVEEPGAQAAILATPEEGTAPLSVDFDGSTSSAFTGKIVSFEWDFGDGTPPTITGARVTHRYDKVGTYDVKLKVVTNENESAETLKKVFVREIPLKACFESSRTSGPAPLSVTFDAKCSTGAVSSFTWNFGDGDDSEARKPAHTFDSPGTYNVTLEVADDKNNINTFSEVIVVEGSVQ